MTVEQVAIETELLAINIYNDTPVVTIEDLNTGSITVTDDSPTVRIRSDQPTKVIVSSGIGNSYDVDTVLNMLAARVSDAALNAELMADISHIRDLWTRVGNQIILTYEDGTEIRNASTIYTDEQIMNIVAALVVMDGKVDLTMSAINQEAHRIDLSVSHLQSLNESLTLAESRIALAEDSITSTVTRLESLDGPTGAVSQMQSSIVQTDSKLDLTVTKTEQNGQAIIENAAGLAITDSDLSLYVQELDTVKGNLNAAQIELTATSITSSVTQQAVGEHGYSLEALETMLANRWGVSLAETGGGVNYVTGMGLMLHPNWVNARAYAIGESVYFYNSGAGHVYDCIAAHTSSTANNPAGVDGATYWVITTNKKSSFIVQADELKVITPNNTVTPLLALNGDALQINVPTVWGSITGAGKPANNATVGAPAGTYVGSTLAETLVSNAATALSTATDAEASATAANNLLTDIAADDLLTPVEKHAVRLEWEILAAEKAGINTQATTFSVTTENTTYNTKFQALADYLNAGVVWSSGIPSWINNTNLSVTTTITGSTFRTRFTEYYDARTILLNVIAIRAKNLADAAQAQADTAIANAAAAQSTANTAASNASTALNTLTDIASDNLLTPDEKPAVIAKRDVIIAEQPGIGSQATTFAITTQKTAYDTAVSALTTYLATLTSPVLWSDLTGNTTIVGTTFHAKFNDVYTTRQTLLNKIAEVAATKAAWENVSGTEALKNDVATGVNHAGTTHAPSNADHTQTTINNGLITTGTLQVIQGGSSTAGITGNTSGDTAVRIWAGGTFANRANAPFRITQGGALFASNATVSGTITGGSKTGFGVGSGYWFNPDGYFDLGDANSFLRRDLTGFKGQGQFSFTSGSSGYNNLLDAPFAQASFEDTSEIANWQNYGGGGELSIVAVSSSLTGGNVLRIGNNSGNDQAWLIHKTLIPFDPSATYRFKFRVRQTAGMGLTYLGFAGVGADGATFVNASGVNSSGNQHYIAAAAAAPASSWTEYTGYLKGHSTSAGGVRQYVSNPAHAHPDVRYLRPLVLVNYSAAAGITEVDFVSVEVLTDALDWAGVSGTGKPASYADVTSENTAKNILEQGVLATLNAIGNKNQLGLNVVGGAAIDTAAVGSAHIADLAVSTLKIGEHQVTVPVGAYTAGAIGVGLTEVEIQKITINPRAGVTTESIPVSLHFAFTMRSSTEYSGRNITVKLYRGTLNSWGTVEYETYIPQPDPTQESIAFSATIMDTPGSGDIVYRLVAKVSAQYSIYNRALVGIGARR